jgi:glycosyltransferase involved in cell wall biosynthesis
MKIGLNATCFNNRSSGAKQRFIGLYSRLFLLMPETEFVIFQPSDCNLESWFDSPNIRFINTPIPSEGTVFKFIRGLNFWHRILDKERFDLFECFNIPTIKNHYGLTFQTIHDVRSLHFQSQGLQTVFAKYAHNNTFNKVNKVITVSNTMRNEILRHYPKANIQYLYNGLDLERFSSKSNTSLPQNHEISLPENFLLSVGHFEERKNYDTLIDAIKSLKNINISHSLVIVGNDNGDKQRIARKIKSMNLQDSIFLYSNLSDSDVTALYNLCSAFIFPSTYEGFGIPVLEAMACRKPFILSNIEVFMEITQNQGIYFEPHNKDSIAEAIKQVMEDSSIADQLKAYGQKRIQDFDFDVLAPALKKIYLSQ